MRKLFLLIIGLNLCLITLSQTIELKTNGYLLKFKKIDTLFYSEYPITSSVKAKAKANDFANTNLKYSFGVISKSKGQSTDEKPSFTTNFYVYEDGTLQAPTSQLFLKPVDAEKFIKTHGHLGRIEEHSVLKGYYYLYIKSQNYKDGQTIFELCNALINDKSVSMVEPVYIRLMKTQNPLRPWEWNINNTGIVPGGIAGADMRVENAWCYSTGENIRVAVIDDGVDLTHPDLQANLLPGFDATGNNSGGAPVANNGHGTNCAGIIASVNNLIGTIGVAFNSRIIPIRMGIVDAGTFNTNDTWIVNCFNEAVARGADVISNSWGGGSPSSQIDAAIQNAVTNGRNGRGCVVLFAAGNFNTNIHYPSTNSNVIAVGASTPCDTRKRSSNDPLQVNPGVQTDPEGTSCDGEFWWGSNFGTGLDVLAPGVWITTTDNVGANGFVAGDFNDHFNGTSSACPNTAAVVALILSANPNLTGQQARNILEQNCFKIPNGNFQPNIPGQPNGTWSNQAGYGRIDAERAVRQAWISTTVSINGPSTFCTTAQYTLNGLPPCVNNVTWSLGYLNNHPNVASLSCTNCTSTTLTKVNDGTVHLIATITLPNSNLTYTYEKYIGAGVPVIKGWYNSPTNPSEPLAASSRFEFNWNDACYTTLISTNMDITANTTVVWEDAGNSGGVTWYQNGNNLNFYFSDLDQWAYFRVTATNSCGSKSWLYRFRSVGENCDGGGPPLRVMLSPNPTTSTINVILTDKKDLKKQKEIVEIRLIDKMGNIKQKWNYGKASGNQFRQLNVANLPPDIYTIMVFDGNVWTSEKFIKH